MYDLRISEVADQDLDTIIKYISVDLANPEAAKNILDKLENVYLFLKDSPLMYSVCDDSRLKAKAYRKVLIGNYILIFRIEKFPRRVYILRFFYGAQDYLTQL